MNLIATAVKLSPLQTSGELIRNVQVSQGKKIDAKLKASVTQLVACAVRKERTDINKVLLEGATVYNTIGSLAALSDAIWFADAVKLHI